MTRVSFGNELSNASCNQKARCDTTVSVHTHFKGNSLANFIMLARLREREPKIWFGCVQGKGDFSSPKSPASYSIGPGLFPRVKFTSHFHRSPLVKRSGAILLRSQYAIMSCIGRTLFFLHAIEQWRISVAPIVWAKKYYIELQGKKYPTYNKT